jgi:hypothetical protein
LHPRTARQHAKTFGLMPRLNSLEVTPLQQMPKTSPLSENLPEVLNNSLSILIDDVEISPVLPLQLASPIADTPLEVEGFDCNHYAESQFNPSTEHCHSDEFLGPFTVTATEPMNEVDGFSEFSSLCSVEEIVKESLSLEDDTACARMMQLNIYDCDQTLFSKTWRRSGNFSFYDFVKIRLDSPCSEFLPVSIKFDR